jgi:class 3 adenylate cyclase
VAGPGEVLVSEAVVEEVDGAAWRFEPADATPLKGIAEPVRLFRAVAGGA